MYRSLILAGVVGALAVPGAAQASDAPTSGDVASASQECRTERGATSATREAFAAHYGTNDNKSNAFGKCVSKKSREEMREREDAQQTASKTCKSERGTSAATREAFEQKYGTGKHKRNAFGKCVSRAAKAAKDAADDHDDEQAADRKRAAKQCSQERGTTSASTDAFDNKYGSNANKSNAFGKCVSKLAKAVHDSEQHS